MYKNFDQVKKGISKLVTKSTNFRKDRSYEVINWLNNEDHQEDLQGVENNFTGFTTHILPLVDVYYREEAIKAWFKRKAGSNVTIAEIQQLYSYDTEMKKVSFSGSLWDTWFVTEAGKSFNKDITLEQVQKLSKNLTIDDLNYLIRRSFKDANEEFNKVETLKELLKLFESEDDKKRIVEAWFENNAKQPMQPQDFKFLSDIYFNEERLKEYLGTDSAKNISATDIIAYLDKMPHDRSSNSRKDIIKAWFKTDTGKKASFADLELMLERLDRSKFEVAITWLTMQKDLDVKKEVDLIDLDDDTKAAPIAAENLIKLFSYENSKDNRAELFGIFTEMRFAELFSFDQLKSVLSEYTNHSQCDKSKDVIAQESFIQQWVNTKELTEEQMKDLGRHNVYKDKERDLYEIYRKNTGKDIILDKEKDELTTASYIAAGSLIPIAMLTAAIVCTVVFPPAGIGMVFAIMGIVVLGVITFATTIPATAGVIGAACAYFTVKSEHKELDVQDAVQKKAAVPNAVPNAGVSGVSAVPANGSGLYPSL